MGRREDEGGGREGEEGGKGRKWEDMIHLSSSSTALTMPC